MPQCRDPASHLARALHLASLSRRGCQCTWRAKLLAREEIGRWLTESRTGCRRIRQCEVHELRRRGPARSRSGGRTRDPVLLQAVDERAAADPEPPRRFRLVAAGRRQRVLDLLALESVEPLPQGHLFLRPRPLLVQRRGPGAPVLPPRAAFSARALRAAPPPRLLLVSPVAPPNSAARRVHL